MKAKLGYVLSIPRYDSLSRHFRTDSKIMIVQLKKWRNSEWLNQFEKNYTSYFNVELVG